MLFQFVKYNTFFLTIEYICLVMRRIFLSILPLLCFVSCTSAPRVRWIEGARETDGKAVHCIEIIGKMPADWTIWFSMFPQKIHATNGSDASVEEYQANLHRIVPEGAFMGDTLRVWYRCSPLKRHSWAPEGFVLQTPRGQKALKTEYVYLPLEPDGDKWFEWNAAHAASAEVPASMIIPVPKCTEAPARVRGWYRLTVSEDGVNVEADDPDGCYYAELTLGQLQENYGGAVPPMVIEDWPDYEYRGFMVDVSRNFTSKDNLLRLIDVLSRYKLNVLHLHLADDEGWRLEIDGIPELTSCGAFHSLDFSRHLQPSYDGCADPASKSLSNGYYTRADFIEILRYAAARHMTVIPEFDTPGHSRAAIKSMQAYERRTGDASMRLQDPSDDSKYYTAQGYTDNVMNVELESVYVFMSHLFGSVSALYAEAGVPMPCIHIGGDEVPRGAWHGRDLHEYFLGRVARLALDNGIKISGWQEVAACKDPSVAALLREASYTANVWLTAWGGENLPYEVADKGFHAVHSNVEYTYADQAYSSNKEEIAHSWCNYIDDIRSFRMPLREHPGVVGVQGQIWTETVRSFDDLCYDVFPKMLGVFERAWNRTPACPENEFYSAIVAREMPFWSGRGIAFHIPQPGLRIVDGQPMTNSAIPCASVTVSKDGERWSARASYLGRTSVTTTAKSPVI